jgi:hypothetical protein
MLDEISVHRECPAILGQSNKYQQQKDEKWLQQVEHIRHQASTPIQWQRDRIELK